MPSEARPGERAAEAPGASAERLDSWKAIASHLGRTERTVRRWEQNEGLPVHRLEHEKRASVYAYRSELDGWLEQRRGTLEAEPSNVLAARPGWAQRHRVLLSLAAVTALLIAAALIAWTRLKPYPRVASIAVLPFENLSNNPQEEWFSDGMTETLITELSKFRFLRVISRTSVMGYKKSQRSLRQVRDDLHVDAVVEGSALRVDGRVRITAQLIDLSTDMHLWGRDYDREFKDVLALHKDLSRAIAQEVNAALAPSVEPAANPPSPRSEALETYYRSVYLLNRRDIEGSINAARQSIRIEPKFAAAYEVLASALMLSSETHLATYGDVLGEVREALRQSLELEPDRGGALSLLGWSRFAFDHDWAAAEPLLRRGYELDPLSGCIYAYFLSAKGEFDPALEACRQTLQRDPANPATYADLGHLQYDARRYADAVVSFQKALQLSPDDRHTHYFLPSALLFAGQPDSAFVTWLAWVTRPRAPLAGREQRFRDEYRTGGWPAVWRCYISMKPKDPRMKLRAFLALNRKEEALAELQVIEQTNDSWWYQLQDPIYDSIRGDPRFKETLKRLRYPEPMWR